VKPAAAIGTGALVQYSLLAVPIAFAGMPLYVYAPDYYATEFGVSLTYIGMLLLALRCFDAVQDPILGSLSDRYAARRPAIVIGAAVLLPLGFTGLFQPPTQQGLLAWFTLMILLATTAFSTLSINLNVPGGLWSRNTHEKTRIAGWREALGLVGLVVAVMLPSVLMQSMSKAAAFAWVSAVLAALTLIGTVAFLCWHRRYGAGLAAAEPRRRQPLHHAVRGVTPATWYFFAVYGVSMLASSIPAILVLFFIRDRLDAEAYTGVFLLLYFLCGALGMPLWRRLSRRWNKPRAWMAAMLLAVASFLWACFLQSGDLWQYAVICALSGLALGADLSLPPSMLADGIHQRRDEHNAALQFGLLAFVAKAALALASALVLPLLEFAGFRAGGPNSEGALLALSFAYAGISCLIKLCCVAMLWRAPLTPYGGNHDAQTHPPAGRSHHYA